MKNKEKYAKEIIEIVCGNGAVNEQTGELKSCSEIKCKDCLLRNGNKGNCEKEMKAWLEQECIEKPVISKRDRALLEYIRKKFKSIARDEDGAIYMFAGIAEKCESKGVFTYNGLSRNISISFDIDFPMVEWSDDEPWLIEDLKKLEVVEDYE